MSILTDDMKQLVAEQRLGYVATVCPDGTPRLAPQGSILVWDDAHLIFADVRSPGTVANLRHNPAIEINVVDPLLRKGYRFKGTATVHTDDPFFKQAMEFYQERGGGTDIESIVRMRVEYTQALISPEYDDGVTEAEVIGKWQRYWQDIFEEGHDTISQV
ncbi:MAG: pyridoxamine 5'-phosphate oxidase family protein [Chloroflexi bacterium]|nr:pyridoxamine 5'-phosphate oxidase family protein [Chloroflexota bacterium]